MEGLRLLTLGGLTIQAGDGLLTGATTRRHRVALLALVAVARNRGLSREKIAAYLWPEKDAEHARHGLNQLVYAQRRHVEDGALFLGKKTLQLNPAIITADVWEFEDALDSGAREAAVRLYAGPFLDGFFLRDAPEFDRWVEDQRRRLQRRCSDAIIGLARAATAAGDHVHALVWWRRAVELDPFDTDTVRHLVQASLIVGDRATALRDVQHHADLLRTELGLDPDPPLLQLIEQVRRASD